jgi:hypothetical protein
MNKKPTILYFLILVSITLFAFRKPEKTSHMVATSISKYLKTDTGGRTVSLDSAQVCIDRFATVMAAHGFTSQAGQNVDIHIKKSSQITTAEVFNGKQLQDWLNATAAQYSSQGRTMMIKIALGIYDLNYLKTYQPNASLRTADNNRIAIFIIPYDSASNGVRALAAQPNGSGGTTGGGTGYDLGGVQP